MGGLSYRNYYSSYWYDPYWYDPYWYDPYWYGGYGYYPSIYNRLWYDVVWYPSSTYLWYDDPWYGYGDTYYDGGYATYYGDWYGADSGITYTSPNSYVLGPVVADSYAAGEEPAPSGDVGQQYVDEAIAAFHAGNYAEALRLAQHATVEMPENGALYLFVAQAYFATGEYLAAAETLHQALRMLPEEDWDLVVANHRDYYGNVGDFTKQLRALEAWLKEEPTAPFGYFWLGYTYGYLGYPEHAVGHLEQAVELSQTDAVAERMLEMFRSKVR